MRKLQNPPMAEPERLPEPHAVKGVWKVATLLAAALVLKPGAADAQSTVQQNDPRDMRLPSGSDYYDYLLQLERARTDMRTRGAIPTPVIGQDCGYFSSTTQTGPIVIVETHYMCTPRFGNRSEMLWGEYAKVTDRIRASIESTRQAARSELTDEQIAAINALFTNGLHDSIAKLSELFNTLDGNARKFVAIKVAMMDFISSVLTNIHLNPADSLGWLENIVYMASRIDVTDPFDIVNCGLFRLSPEDWAVYVSLADLFEHIDRDHTYEFQALSSNYIFRGPLSMLSVADMQRVQDYVMENLSPDSFRALTPAEQAEEISEILSELGIAPSIGVPIASAAAVLTRVGEQSGASVEVMRPIYSPTDAQTMMDAAASFLTSEEVTAFKIFLGLEEAPVLPPAPPAQINPDDCSNPFMLATNYILQGPLAQLDGNAKEQVITYLMGNISRIMDGPTSSFSGLPLLRQSGVIMNTVRELELDVGMDSTLASVAAVLSHVGTQRGASQEVMRSINSPQDASTMMDAADSFLTPEEAAEFRGLFGLARPESVSSLSP